jgi:hypothetical protein
MARILDAFAALIGAEGDRAGYVADIERLGAAIQRHAWDDAEGWFGYVLHRDGGTSLLRHASGQNHNRGIDGVYPLVAGICTPEQRRRLLDHLFDPACLWTPAGLGTVDQGAAYYQSDGYWNGSVWFPHQWVLWKTLLDLGEAERAWQVARTALDIWARNTDATWNCYEHIHAANGTGAGCPHFSGLSCPVLDWYDAVAIPGRLTTGFDGLILAQTWTPPRDGVDAELRFVHAAGERRTILATLAGSGPWRATWNGEPVPVASPHPGHLWITLPAAATQGRLVVAAP